MHQINANILKSVIKIIRAISCVLTLFKNFLTLRHNTAFRILNSNKAQMTPNVSKIYKNLLRSIDTYVYGLSSKNAIYYNLIIKF